MKTLDQWKEELIGKTFGRLVVLDIIQCYDNKGRRAGCKAVCKCSCGNTKEVSIQHLLRGTISCGCAQKEIARSLIGKARESLFSNKEICRENGRKNGKRNVKYALSYLQEHPEIMKENGRRNVWAAQKALAELNVRDEALRKAHESILKERKSSFQQYWESFCEALSFQFDLSFETEFELEDHHFDIKIGTYLIECNGLYWHRFQSLKERENEEFSASYPKDRHIELRNIAERNGYHLIQIWELPEKYDFYRDLIIGHLLDDIDYRDYINNDLLDNDLGFSVEGEFIPPSLESYDRSRLDHADSSTSESNLTFVYRSGYTKVI